MCESVTVGDIWLIERLVLIIFVKFVTCAIILSNTLRNQLIAATFGIGHYLYTLEALAVNNGWSRLVVLLLGDPHLLEG
jgi:hypothetical protein